MRRFLLFILTLSVAAAPGVAQSSRVSLTFASQNKNRAFDSAVDEYRRLWAAEGGRVIEAMERVSTLKFPEKNVKVEVYEGPSFAGLRLNRDGVPTGTSGPMRLRASYSADNKKGTLVHELAHRMNVQLKKRPKELDEHRLLFLYLYDLYVDLYGREFADGQVAFGRTLKGLYDYDGAWNWALSMGPEQRRAMFEQVLTSNRSSR